MAINEKTHEERVFRWRIQKNVWELKLSRATNENDKSVAKVMIEHAKAALKLLGMTEESKEKTIETKGSIDVPKKRVVNTSMYAHRTNASEDTISTVGS